MYFEVLLLGAVLAAFAVIALFVLMVTAEPATDGKLLQSERYFIGPQKDTRTPCPEPYAPWSESNGVYLSIIAPAYNEGSCLIPQTTLFVLQ
jgi:hypothetical protein